MFPIIGSTVPLSLGIVSRAPGGCAPLPKLLLELDHVLSSAVDLDGLHRERHLEDNLVEEVGCVADGGSPAGFRAGPFGDGIDGNQLLDGPPSAPVGDGHAVKLEDIPGPYLLESCGPPARPLPLAAGNTWRHSTRKDTRSLCPLARYLSAPCRIL